MRKLSIRELDLKGKRVFMRVDFNVPMNDAGEITDDTRLRASVPTIQFALEKGAKLILASHLGRPKGKPDPKFSLRPVAVRLGKLLGRKVSFANNCVGSDAEKQVTSLGEGEVLLLENLRFHLEEEKNDPEFARRLALLADVYVNDAFGTAHRAHASTEGITHNLPVSAAGLLMQKELDYIGRALGKPARPYLAIMGGAKVSDKIDLLQNLMKLADGFLIGGAMAYTFLKAQGAEVGRSKLESDKLNLARELLDECKRRGVALRLPSDHVVAEKAEPSARVTVVPGGSIPPEQMGVDIGPATRTEFAQEIARARTVVWNGPMGIFEIDAFSEGTLAIARAVATCPGVSIVGGGDSVAALAKAGVTSKVGHISTGGGAFLESLSGIKLPGVEALTEK